jgi:methyl-accepting chemotaxis protein
VQSLALFFQHEQQGRSMEWLSNMKVGTKLIAGFLLVAGIGALIGISGIRQASQINDLAQLMYEREIAGLSHASEANIQLIAASRAVRSAVLATTDAERQRHIDNVQQRLQITREELDKTGQFFATDEGRALVRETTQVLQTYSAGIQTVLEQLRQEPLSDNRVSVERMNGFRAAADKADDLIGQLVARKKDNAKALNDETDAIYGRIRVLLIALTLGGVAAGVVIGSLLTRGLTRQLGGEPGDVARVAEAIAQGNLAFPIDASAARPGSVVAAMQAMQGSLREVVSTVRASSDSIATGAGQIAAGNADLSQRTEEQASNLEETAASMEELTSTVEANSETALQAAQLARSASAAAEQGGEVVGQVVSMMGRINSSSQKISDIIGVIDGIAFQTNILALNAAVEAARAGEQGRGFAVVAGEVRSLAQKSAEAAKEIKALINESVDNVTSGSQLVNTAGEAMGGIVSEVRRVSDLINEITAATREQSLGISQISDAVAQLDQVTQQNAALVEESASAADSLNQQAKHLVRAVAVFQLEGGGGNRSQGRSTSGSGGAALPRPRAPMPAFPAPALARSRAGDAGEWAQF